MLKEFAKRTDGAVMLIVAFAAMALIGAVGVAVDVGRNQTVQAKLQNAVDVAGLAAGAAVGSGDLVAVATKYVQVNFNNGTLGANLKSVTVTLSTDKRTLTVTAAATIPTTIMKIFGREQVPIAASTEVAISYKGLELALVLDTTGSMKGSKLASLKIAAHDLVTILFGTAVQDNVWVGIVPFSQTVNIGPARTHWLNASQYAGLDWGASSWAGCVDERYSFNRDVTDDPPFDLAFPGQAVPAPPYERMNAYFVPKYYNLVVNGRPVLVTNFNGPNANCPSPITPLSNSKETVNAGIDALVAQGDTHVNIGAVWGWRLLSPRWRGYWGGAMNANSLPLNYKTPLMSKVVILMTDGANTMWAGIRTAYGYLGDGYLGTTNASTFVAKLDSKLAGVCNEMKARGIVVYTILFEESSPTIINLLKNCASSPDYFFNSATEAELQKSFRTIGSSLANLRISK